MKERIQIDGVWYVRETSQGPGSGEWFSGTKNPGRNSTGFPTVQLYIDGRTEFGYCTDNGNWFIRTSIKVPIEVCEDNGGKYERLSRRDFTWKYLAAEKVDLEGRPWRVPPPFKFFNGDQVMLYGNSVVLTIDGATAKYDENSQSFEVTYGVRGEADESEIKLVERSKK